MDGTELTDSHVMANNTTDATDPISPPAEERPQRRVWWLVGGLIVAGFAALACLAVTTVGVVVLRGVDREPVSSQSVGSTPAPTPTERLPDETAAAEPAAAASSGRIAFVDPTGRLGTLAPDGSDMRLLSDAGWRMQFPAWSPDNGRIAAIASDGERGAVRVFADETDAEPIEIYGSREQPPFYLYWAPDSTQVSFLANARRAIGLWLAPADGQAEARLLASGQPFYWDWTEDSAELLVHTGTVGGDARLGFIDTNGDSSGNAFPGPGLFQAPGLSADGLYLAYAVAEGRELRVVVEDRQSGRRVDVAHAGLAALSWSPTEPLLAFTSPTTSQPSFVGPLRLLDAATGDTRTLVDEAVTGFFWSPTGKSIAYLTLEPSSTSPGAGRPAGLAAVGSQPDQQPQHPTIRLRLSVVDLADGQQRLLTSFQPTDLFVTQFLPFFDQYALSHHLWSPSGDALVLPMVGTNGGEAVYVVPMDGHAPRRIVAGSMGFWSN